MTIDSGDTAWVLASAALVLLMTPGVALFYGGMVRAKSVLNMMMMSFGAMATISVVWVLWGYSEAFGESWHGLVGDPFQHFGLANLLDGDTAVYGYKAAAEGVAAHGGIPAMAFVAFQAVFAIITVALISGAIADRAKYSTWLIFTVVWATIVYFPVAHWVFAFDSYAAAKGGWIANSLKTIDFAGGTAVHINAGAAGLVLALIIGKRVGFRKDPMRPHNMTLVMLGAALLWFGWFGFNAGSALGANNTAAVTWVNTLAATGAACLGWLATERIRNGHGTSLGAASGIVAGLVAITPACSAVTPIGAVAIGLLAGVLCALAVSLKFRFGYDDSLDVVGVHLVGGLVGTIAIGFVASASAPAGVDGLFYGGGLDQLWRQAVGAGAVLVYSFVVTALIGLALHKTLGFRIERDAEIQGIDLEEHAETSYDLGSLGGGGLSHVGGPMFGSPTASSAPSTVTINRQGATS
ncbi:MAG: ammonium transporter [Dermatophilaceae bacterium]|nr:ammonium transporter [Dermatophilaceae bacterium]